MGLEPIRLADPGEWTYLHVADALYSGGAEGVVYSVGGSPADAGSDVISATLLSGLNNDGVISSGGYLLIPVLYRGRPVLSSDLFVIEPQVEITSAPPNASYVYAAAGFTAAGATFATALEWQLWGTNYQPAGNPRSYAFWRNGGAASDAAGSTAAHTRSGFMTDFRTGSIAWRQDGRCFTGSDTIVNTTARNIQAALTTTGPMYFVLALGSKGGALTANRAISVKARYRVAKWEEA